VIKKTVWYWHKNRYKDQWNRTEGPDTNPHNYKHLMFNKGAQNICWRKDNFPTNSARKTGFLPAED
jgi:hypothetical protein